MIHLMRFGIWLLAVMTSLLTDVSTKAAHHTFVAYHYSHTSAILLITLGALLLAFGIRHSALFALGTGLMAGGLWGNGGEVLLHGYASDWIPVAGWLTNVADISGVVGISCCTLGYLWSIGRAALALRARSEET